MSRIAGIDGCKTGWFVVSEDLDARRIEWGVLPDFSTVLERLSDYDAIAVDIPIGLPSVGPRKCDLLARKLLGPGKTSSVFPAPVRGALGARTHAEASALREQVDGKRMSIQAFAILAKTEEVDATIRKRGQAESRVFEVHPEVSFLELAGGRPMQEKKKKVAGRNERLGHLEKHFRRVTLENALAEYPSSEVAKDDVLDAFVALWTARRLSIGKAVRSPVIPEFDGQDLDMVIWR